MTFCEQMIPALSALLEPGETLQAPVYGGILHRRSCTYGYFGLTDQALLVALLQGSTKAIAGNSGCRLRRSGQSGCEGAWSHSST